MRVAVFSDTWEPEINGVSKTVQGMRDYFHQQDIPCLFFVPRYPGDRTEQADVLRFTGTRVWFSKSNRLAMPGRATVERLLRDFRPDVVHIVTEYSMGYAGLRAARAMGLPIVISCHMDIEQLLRFYHMQIFSKLIHRHFIVFHRYGTLRLCPTTAFRDALAARGFGTFSVWHRGVRTEVFSPSFRTGAWRETLHAGNRFVCLYVGRLAPEKGLDVWIDAIRKINQTHADAFLFAVAGSGLLDERLQKCGIPNLRMTGFVEGELLSRLYADSDLFVLPSGTETFGNTFLEAQASGLPCVCVDRGGVTDMARHDENAYVVPYGDADALADAVLTLWHDADTRRRLARGGLKLAASRSWRAGMDELCAYYQTAIDRKRMGGETNGSI